jgi:hypothetical protein
MMFGHFNIVNLSVYIQYLVTNTGSKLLSSSRTYEKEVMKDLHGFVLVRG